MFMATRCRQPERYRIRPSRALIINNTLFTLDNIIIIQRYTVANIVYSTVDVIARLAVIDAIAVADVQPFLSAIPPDGVLHKPGKHRRERRIEGVGIDAIARQSG